MWHNRSPGIRTKLLLPGVAALAVLLALMQWLWLPWQQERALRHIGEEQRLKLDIVSMALVEPLLSGNLGQVHTTLEAVLKADPMWRQLELTSVSGQPLYPLETVERAALAGTTTITRNITSSTEPLAQLTPDFDQNTALAQLTLHFDPSAKLAQESSAMQLIGLIIFAVICAGMVLSFLLQDWWVRRPVEKMAAAARTLAEGDFDTPVAIPGQDEIGRLAILLETMRLRLRAMTAELRQSEQRHLAVISHIPDGIITVRGDGAIASANAAACAIFGYDEEELLGRNISMLVPQQQRADHEVWFASAERRRRFMGQEAIEIVAARRGEQPFPAEIKVTEIKGAAEPLYLALMQDISARKQAEQALTAAMTEMEREKNTLQAILLGTMASSAEQVFRLSAMMAATALEADAVIVAGIADPAMRIARTVAVWSAGELQENFEYHLDQTPGAEEEGQNYVCITEGACWRHPECTLLTERAATAYLAMPLLNSQGVAIGHLATLFRQPLQDEARAVAIMKIFAARLSAELERAAAKRIRDEQSQHTQTIVDNIGEGIITIDENGVITGFNHAAEAIFGYAAAAVSGRNVSMLMPPAQGSRHDSYLASSDKRAIGTTREVTGLRKDGALFDMELHISQISRGGRPVFIGLVRDISRRKSDEAERRQLQQHLAQAQKMQAIGQLTGGIAHDFNNMLAGILGFAELAQERARQLDDTSLPLFLAEIYRAGERARDLVAKMLAFSRGRDVSTPEPVLLAAAIPEMMKMLRPVLPATIMIRTELDPAAPPVVLDTVELQQILMNLCINARDAMNSDGWIIIEVRRVTLANAVCNSCHAQFSGDHIELSVSDNGPGMDAATLQRIFEPFFTTKEVGKGTGMGLAMVHGIVHDRHGHIVVESQPGAGSRFRLLFGI
jgi:PAS domain S-box-containing protein